MNTEDRFLLHRARNLAVALDESGKQLQAATVTELIERLEVLIDGPVDDDAVIDKAFNEHSLPSRMNGLDRNKYDFVGGWKAARIAYGSKAVASVVPNSGGQNISVERYVESVTIEREVFKTLVETSLLFNFWVENVGRLSLAAEAADKQLDTIRFRFVLNPPGRRAQFPREAVIQALMDIKQVLSVPHYG